MCILCNLVEEEFKSFASARIGCFVVSTYTSSMQDIKSKCERGETVGST